MKKIFGNEAVSYIIFGLLTTAVDWIVYSGMRFAGAEYMISTVFSWTAAVLFAYITNKIIVFKSMSMSPAKIFSELIAFTGARIFTGIMNLFGMWIMVTVLGGNDFIAKALLSVLVVILNYVFSKLFIFKK